jgi:hypothetical protein
MSLRFENSYHRVLTADVPRPVQIPKLSLPEAWQACFGQCVGLIWASSLSSCLSPRWHPCKTSPFKAMLGSQLLSNNRAPTAGGQYHWVSEFAPRRHQKPLSYLSGVSIPIKRTSTIKALIVSKGGFQLSAGKALSLSTPRLLD